MAMKLFARITINKAGEMDKYWRCNIADYIIQTAGWLRYYGKDLGHTPLMHKYRYLKDDGSIVTAAIITIKDPAGMSPSRRTAAVKWLKKQAKWFRDHGHEATTKKLVLRYGQMEKEVKRG